MTNPLLQEWDTPHGFPPFDQIRPEHFLPAIKQAIEAHTAEIDTIAGNSSPPTFENTIEALEDSGRLLTKITPVFHVRAASDADDEIRALQSEITPMLTAHDGAILTRSDLFERIEAVAASDTSALSSEQQRLIDETRLRFERAGAALDEKTKARVLEIDRDIAGMTTTFGQNLVRGASKFELVLETEDDLKGLPASVRSSAASEAEQRGKPGKYVFTTSRSSITPFLQYSQRRDLREIMWRAYTAQGNNNDEFDNKPLIDSISTRRAERARLMGYQSHAEYVLADRMAGTPDAVTRLLDQIRAPADKRVREEAAKLQDLIQSEGGNFKLAAWDWWYYTEKRRAAEFSLNAEDIKPYFPMEQVRQGAFDVAHKLYGITFTPRDDVPTYHDDVEAFEVNDADGSLIGLFLTDYFMRDSKRSGAWMNAVRSHATLGGKQYPIIFNTCNFSKGAPSLLGTDEVRTLFHEFGHGLHGLLSKVSYRSLSGTAVKKDFVELPSQIMEHWAEEPSVLKSFARHYKTGETIPDELIDKILATSSFNSGFATTEYLAASYLDMHWHSADAADSGDDVETIESNAMTAIDLIDEVAPRYRSTYFQHIFSGGYSAGYYSYIWAEVLDADAYEAFRENGIFDQETAKSFRKNVLEMGGSEDPMELYRRFRGRNPDVAPLLKGRGLA